MEASKRLIFVLITPFYFIGELLCLVFFIPFWIATGGNLRLEFEDRAIKFRDWLIPGNSFYK